jgi:NAD(P)-dependent dehydrogenase (short-subunit alcohol dehydrogenase family)
VELDGRTALVTGAGSGIGRALAVGLAAAGAVPVLVGRAVGRLEGTADRVRAAGGRAVVLSADLAAPDAVPDLLDRVAAGAGVVDVLINNAATVAPLAPSAEVDPGEWVAAIQLNTVAPALLAFGLLPGMLERGGGRIVNVSSGIVSNPAVMTGANSYPTSKAALEAHTLNLAAELAGTGVTVNVYRPGTVDTAMQTYIRDHGAGKVSDATHRRFLDMHRDGALITPEASAAALLRRLPGDDNGQIWTPGTPA